MKGRSRCAMRSSDVGEWKQYVSDFQILGKVVRTSCQEIGELEKQAGVENGEIGKTVRVVLKVIEESTVLPAQPTGICVIPSLYHANLISAAHRSPIIVCLLRSRQMFVEITPDSVLVWSVAQ